jgi:hypothetical protein
MKTPFQLIAVALCLCTGMADQAFAASPAHAMAMGAAAESATGVAPQLHAAMRELWHGHVVHTREYAMAVHAGDKAAAGAAADAVVANAKQIAGAVGSFYGKAAGDQMLTLLAGHWGGVKALTDAVHANDSAAQSQAMHTLASNSADIAKFLSRANPNLPEAAVLNLMTTHVAHHATQIQQIMAGDMKAEQGTWGAIQQHMDMFADALSGGIAKQFPDKAK